MVIIQMPRQHARTNIYVIDDELWDWAQYRAKRLKCETTSNYLFELIKMDKEKDLIKKEGLIK